MNRMPALLCAVAVSVLAAACTQKSGSDAKNSEVVAEVDGYKITRTMYDVYVTTVSNGADKLTPEQKAGLLDNLVRGQLLAKQAELNGVAKADKAQATLELQRLNILSQAATENFLKDKTATDDELRAEYQQRVGTMEKHQYRASHVLVKTEPEARQIIGALKAGANFAAIAKAQSLDNVSKEKGGDLEWFSPNAMTPDFGNAVAALKKGETSQNPVQTEYGFHVIRVTDIRDSVPPSFEAVKEQMKQAVDGKKLKTWVEELTKKAKVTKSL